jgi:cell division septal protein FtsQ
VRLVSAPADKRFRRAHVKPSRRRRWSTVLKPLATYGTLVLFVVLAVYKGGQVIALARVLKVDVILVDGNVRVSTPRVLDILDGLRGENILLSDLHAWRDRLCEAPWIRDAMLKRTLPSTIEVFVQERTPLAIGRVGGALYIVDGQGVVLDEYGPEYADFDLPIVDGLITTKTAPGGRTDEKRAALVARVMGALAAKPQVAVRVSQIDVRDARNATVILSGDGAVLVLGNDRFLQRLEAYLELGPALRERVPEIDSIDLRFDEHDENGKVSDRRIYVRPAAAGRQAAVSPRVGQFVPSKNTESTRSEQRR